METIIPDGYYEYDPSTGQITLLPPYNSITKAQVKSIYNLPQHQLLYDCRNSPPEQYISPQFTMSSTAPASDTTVYWSAVV